MPGPGGLPDAAIIALWDARLLSGSPSDQVAAWPDSGPVGQDDLVQATSANRPVITDSGFDGVRSVLFDGVNDRLDSALDQTYTGDFAVITAVEYVAAPSAGGAGVVYSAAGIPNKHLLAFDRQDEDTWVVMSSGGAANQHHFGHFLDLTTLPRLVMTQLVRNDGPHKLWERKALVIDVTDSSMEDTDLNNLTAVKLGAREDNSRFGNSRIGFHLIVDMAETDEAGLLAARDAIGAAFNVPDFEDDEPTFDLSVGATRTGTIA